MDVGRDGYLPGYCTFIFLSSDQCLKLIIIIYLAIKIHIQFNKKYRKMESSRKNDPIREITIIGVGVSTKSICSSSINY